MEQKGEASRCTLPAQGFYPLGFFLQPQSLIHADPFGLTTPPLPCATFISTSVQGKDLKAGKWGSLDASLSFLEQTVHILASSHGFLLCTTNIRTKINYIICNPVTREHVILPEPNRFYEYVAMAFICSSGGGISFGEVRYEVVRAGVANPRELMTILEIEIFSSETGEWKEFSIISPSPFRLVVASTDVMVLEDIIYWKDPRLALVAYDRAQESVRIIDLPRETFTIRSDFVSQSKGKIFYSRTGVRSGTHCIEIWVLKDGDGDGNGNGNSNSNNLWNMKHRVSLREMIQRNPISGGTVESCGNVIVKHMHPLNSEQIFLQVFGKPYFYDIKSRQLIRISNQWTTVCRYFLYEWPCAALPQ